MKRPVWDRYLFWHSEKISVGYNNSISAARVFLVISRAHNVRDIVVAIWMLRVKKPTVSSFLIVYQFYAQVELVLYAYFDTGTIPSVDIPPKDGRCPKRP